MIRFYTKLFTSIATVCFVAVLTSAGSVKHIAFVVLEIYNDFNFKLFSFPFFSIGTGALVLWLTFGTTS